MARMQMKDRVYAKISHFPLPKKKDNILLTQSKKKIMVNLLWPVEGEILIKPPSLVRGVFQVTL